MVTNPDGYQCLNLEPDPMSAVATPDLHGE